MPTEEERRTQMIVKINQTIVESGFVTLTMDQIAKIMGVSRGKLYQYFPSKEAVIKAVVTRYFKFMTQQTIPEVQTPAEYATAFPQVFLELVTLVASSSAAFRQDLQTMPELAQEFTTRYTAWLKAVADFLAAGQKNQAFQTTVVPALFLIQIEATVPALMDRNRLEQQRLFLNEVLPDYLKMMVSQVVAPEYQGQVQLTAVANQLQQLTAKYQQALLGGLL
ncbi:TetR/AcrR family transcriptional regulator [Agrilactobacillus yilanensis]|uniref:TetR/AcrR family transcriptional regulator n=1 Tax=Agrilactobacillus yilanensis TaxID=2485997 RepID=A0ABW4J5A2_9LACO|nr:TetR/AcrR family transcriptional regulator [Agrilactobacillus yilanensis]